MFTRFKKFDLRPLVVIIYSFTKIDDYNKLSMIYQEICHRKLKELPNDYAHIELIWFPHIYSYLSLHPMFTKTPNLHYSRKKYLYLNRKYLMRFYRQPRPS